jgi:D-alanine transaminase
MITYINGKYCDEDNSFVSTNDRGFIFGDGVYEAFRVYNNKLFKFEEHKDRFQRSIDALHINFTIKNELEDIFEELLVKNSYESKELVYYIQITRGSAPRVHYFPSRDTKVGVYAFLKPVNIDKNIFEDGVKVCTVPDNRWGRCDIKCISLVANCMANEIAKQQGCAEALFVHDGVITEGTSSNVCFIKDNQLHTHAKTNRILHGVTRNLVLELCLKNGIVVHEFPILLSEINEMDEAFLTSTTKEITPISSIDGKQIGNGKVGNVTKRLQSLFSVEVEKCSC